MGEGLVGCSEVLSLESLQSTDMIKHALSCLIHQSCWLLYVRVITDGDGWKFTFQTLTVKMYINLKQAFICYLVTSDTPGRSTGNM